jgi:hypothetical protein
MALPPQSAGPTSIPAPNRSRLPFASPAGMGGGPTRMTQPVPQPSPRISPAANVRPEGRLALPSNFRSWLLSAAGMRLRLFTRIPRGRIHHGIERDSVNKRHPKFISFHLLPPGLRRSVRKKPVPASNVTQHRLPSFGGSRAGSYRRGPIRFTKRIGDGSHGIPPRVATFSWRFSRNPLSGQPCSPCVAGASLDVHRESVRVVNVSTSVQTPRTGPGTNSENESDGR